jgi:hypothetical protein
VELEKCRHVKYCMRGCLRVRLCVRIGQRFHVQFSPQGGLLLYFQLNFPYTVCIDNKL